ncbi:TetR/AcrR family transcriptional regulator [Sphaerisporangium aureirubrum]|uniref:TetR/AcrR family transcriptional regulator n=1 Tax=Sphaerisporangium aureirubrum TaxID=1544736 RepID=A0ABW1NGC3_9ACTN
MIRSISARSSRREYRAASTVTATSPATPITLEEVARRARVARSTIYTIFTSRGALFDAVFHDVLHRAGFDRIVAATIHRDEQSRAQGMQNLVSRLTTQNHLHPSITPSEAVNTLYILTSFESFDLLYTARGLPPATSRPT